MNRSVADLFKTELERSGAASSLTDLIKSPGWAILQQIITEDIKSAREKLESSTFSDLREIDDLQNLIGVMKSVLVLPRSIIEQCAEDPNFKPSPDADPYDKIEQQQENPETKP